MGLAPQPSDPLLLSLDEGLDEGDDFCPCQLLACQFNGSANNNKSKSTGRQVGLPEALYKADQGCP